MSAQQVLRQPLEERKASDKRHAAVDLRPDRGKDRALSPAAFGARRAALETVDGGEAAARITACTKR